MLRKFFESRRKNSSEREKKDHTPSDGFGTRDSFDVNFGLDEEIINLLDTLEELKANVEFTVLADEGPIGTQLNFLVGALEETTAQMRAMAEASNKKTGRGF